MEKKIGLLRGKSIGIIDFAKWENDIELIAKHLIKNEFERKKWKFGWSFGDFLLIFAVLLGLTEGIAESYISGLGLNFSEAVGGVGEAISDGRDKSVIKTTELEDKYLKKK